MTFVHPPGHSAPGGDDAPATTLHVPAVAGAVRGVRG